MKHLFLFLIRAYQLLLSPWLGQHCRFYPSCSSYAQEAINEHGAMRGLVLTVKRLSRCHPWHHGGVDLVPPVHACQGSSMTTAHHTETNAPYSHPTCKDRD